MAADPHASRKAWLRFQLVTQGLFAPVEVTDDYYRTNFISGPCKSLLSEARRAYEDRLRLAIAHNVCTVTDLAMLLDLRTDWLIAELRPTSSTDISELRCSPSGSPSSVVTKSSPAQAEKRDNLDSTVSTLVGRDERQPLKVLLHADGRSSLMLEGTQNERCGSADGATGRSVPHLAGLRLTHPRF